MLEAASHPARTARNHLRVLAAEARVPRSRADEMLELVDLDDAARRRSGGFSLGMTQRLGLAAALLAMALLTAGLGMGDAGQKGYSTPEQLRETILAVGYAAVFFLATVFAGMLGVVVGAITRNPTTAMVAIFCVWIAGKIIGDWIGDAAQYLPFALLENVLGLTTPMAWGYAALALAGMTAALGLVAQRVSVTRDVT